MHLCRLLSLLLAALFALFTCCSTLLADDRPSRYVRQLPGSDIVIVFVHGVLGDSETTWGTGKAYWPFMLFGDSTFDGSDIFVYSYPTSMWASQSPDELAEDMRVQLNAYGVSDHRRIVFLAHSMGGLITRAFLVKNRAVAERTTLLFGAPGPLQGR